ncbi:MAG: response regulator transcription factor [Saprospiraceae bacterium]|nr:response regulator transcription factor [Saprospiraceae bacterium]
MKNKTMPPYRILLADDHQIILDGLRDIIESTTDFLVVGRAVNGKAAVSAVAASLPDLLLMDLNMPGMDGLEVLKEVRQRFPKVKVLVLTMYDSVELAKKALSMGANGYLLKEHGKDELLTALRQVVTGEQYLSEKIRRQIQPDKVRFQDDFQKKLSLSQRETEILRLIARSYTNKEIADKLYLSELTVQTHRRNLKRKLKAEHTADLVRFAYENGISDL